MYGPKVGQPAPDFECEAYFGGEFKKVNLRELRGKWVCLYFYPLDFTFVCPTEIRAFAMHENDFRELNCVVIGCSTDSKYSHKAWFERDIPDARHPVMADTSHRVSRDYGVLIEQDGIALRGTFLIDPHGVLQWMSVNALGVGRSVDETLRMLDALQTIKEGEVCPADWRKGQATLKTK